MTSIVMQHSLEIVGTAVVFVELAVVDHAAGVDNDVWETVDVDLTFVVLVADNAACNDADMGAGAVLECAVDDTVAPVVLGYTVVDTVLGAHVFCTLGDIAVGFDCTVDCCYGVGTAFAVAC